MSKIYKKIFLFLLILFLYKPIYAYDFFNPGFIFSTGLNTDALPGTYGFFGGMLYLNVGGFMNIGGQFNKHFAISWDNNFNFSSRMIFYNYKKFNFFTDSSFNWSTLLNFNSGKSIYDWSFYFGFGTSLT